MTFDPEHIAQLAARARDPDTRTEAFDEMFAAKHEDTLKAMKAIEDDLAELRTALPFRVELFTMDTDVLIGRLVGEFENLATYLFHVTLAVRLSRGQRRSR